MRSIPLGPYDLRVPIGRGGMGEVWRAVHRASARPVAVKVMRPAAASRPELVASFHKEVRAAAGLSHPHIAAVLDAGTLPDEVEQVSRGRLRGGSPFLVTELAFGSLAGAPQPASWTEVFPVLVALLSALAHAHAHGVTHRDIKPGNVLLAGPPDEDPAVALPLSSGTLAGHLGTRVLLADFGLAWIGAEGRAEAETASGTPAYMAPEQLDGRWRDIGPWTDMYGLGCLIWWLIAGRTPFQPRNYEQAVLHQHRMLPVLRPLFPVPRGLEGWLLRMVARDPGARFQVAADALHGLRGLGDAALHEGADLPDPELTQPIGLIRDPPDRRPEREPILLPFARVPPPMPSSWRSLPQRPRRAPPLSDGLALHGIVPVPMLGREPERDALWFELAAVHAERRTRVVVVHGPPGTGKRRMLAWLRETAAEHGLAHPLDLSFGEKGEGLSELVSGVLGCAELEREALHGRVETWLMRHGLQDPLATRALARLASQGGAGLREGEVHEALRALISLLARGRPVILTLREIQASPDAVALVERLLGTGGSLPLLIVATLDSVGRPARGTRLGTLLAAPLVRALELGPLPLWHHKELVQVLLPLDPDLAATVEARSRGFPGHAAGLIDAWVRQGALVPGPVGLRLRPDVDAYVPGLQAPWRQLLDPLLAGSSAAEHDALALAALLGEPVDLDTWTRATQRAGLPTPLGLVDLLAARGLVRQFQRPRPSFTFVHPVLSECLICDARRAGRLEALHRAAALVFVDAEDPGSAARLGHHLFALGDPISAFALLERVGMFTLRSTIPEELGLINVRERAMVEAGLPPQDPRWGELWLRRGRVELAACALEQGSYTAARAEEAAARHGWGQVELGARVLRGRLAHLRGHLDHAHSLLVDAVDDAVEQGALGLELEALLALSAVHIRRHEFDTAEQRLDRVRAALEAMGRPAARGLLDAGQLLVRGHLYAERGRLEEARGAFVEAMSVFRGSDQEGRLGEARCLAALGLIAQMEGLYARSERRLKQAVSLAEVAGSGYALAQAVPLAMLALRARDTWRARMLAVSALEHTVRLGMDAEAALLRLVLGVACAMDGDLPGWGAAHAQAMVFFERHRWRSSELSTLLLMAEGLGPWQRSAEPDTGDGAVAMV